MAQQLRAEGAQWRAGRFGWGRAEGAGWPPTGGKQRWQAGAQQLDGSLHRAEAASSLAPPVARGGGEAAAAAGQPSARPECVFVCVCVIIFRCVALACMCVCAWWVGGRARVGWARIQAAVRRTGREQYARGLSTRHSSAACMASVGPGSNRRKEDCMASVTRRVPAERRAGRAGAVNGAQGGGDGCAGRVWRRCRTTSAGEVQIEAEVARVCAAVVSVSTSVPRVGHQQPSCHPNRRPRQWKGVGPRQRVAEGARQEPGAA